MYQTSHEDRKIQLERAACDAAVCWGSEQPVGIELVLLAAERMLADADRCLASRFAENRDFPPGERNRLTGTAARLSREVEALRLRLEDDQADLARVNRERERYERRRCQDHAAAVAAELPAHLMELGEGMLRALREEADHG